VARIDEALRHARGSDPARVLQVAVVGGGAAGVELAFTLQARLRRARLPSAFTLYTASGILVGEHPRVSARVRLELERRGIELALERALGAEKGALLLASGRRPADLILWATGAAPLDFDAEERLPRSPDGFIAVEPTLQVQGFANLFAAGDCAGIVHHPWVRKAGVYAVRQGPYLDANLRAQLCESEVSAYPPQRDVLALLNLGDRSALGAKWGLTATGYAVWRIKHRIDRHFVRRHQVLRADGAPARGFPSAAPAESAAPPGSEAPPHQEGEGVPLSVLDLEQALSRLEPTLHPELGTAGPWPPEDAAALMQLLDEFPAFTDDPWLAGRVAALHAASPLLARSGVPRRALALAAVPDGGRGGAADSLYQVFAGVSASLKTLNVSLVGGRAVRGRALRVGVLLSEDPNDSAPPHAAVLVAGDVLVLSKPLGTGVLLAADRQGLARGPWIQAALASMLRSNAAAARVAREHASRVCATVGAAGLAARLAELLAASGVSAELEAAALPVLAGSLALLRRGLRCPEHAHNARSTDAVRVAEALRGDPRVELLFDAQTSGGLVFAVAAPRAAAAVAALRAAGDGHARAIGCSVACGSERPALAIV